jgi:hypothetical protein
MLRMGDVPTCSCHVPNSESQIRIISIVLFHLLVPSLATVTASDTVSTTKDTAEAYYSSHFLYLSAYQQPVANHRRALNVYKTKLD